MSTIEAFRGEWYASLDTAPVPNCGLRLGLVPEIMLRGDAKRWAARQVDKLTDRTDRTGPDQAERRAILDRAVRIFRQGTVWIGGLGRQDPEAFALAMRDITGLPPVLTERWGAMLRSRLDGLPAGRQHDGITLCWLPANTFTCLESVLGAVLDSAAVWIRPSQREPVSAARFTAALLEAGWPAERLAFYPCRSSLLPTLCRITDRQTVYGGPTLAASVPDGPGLSLHGPGRGCALVHPEAEPVETAEWLADLVAADSGRFCHNVCTVACLGDPEPVARELARLLDGIRLSPPDPRWPQASCSDSEARRIAGTLANGVSGRDAWVTRRDLVVAAGGATYLAPSLVRVEPAPGHPLLGRELPFPFAAVVGVDPVEATRLADQSQFVYSSRSRGEAR